ncbi:MAG: aldo/keto reductase [Rhizobiaceae bacterium]
MSIYFQKSNQRIFGTYPLRGAELKTAMRAASDTGYRAFDTAQMYGNEADVGAALADVSVPRDELCIATKVHPDNFAPDRFLESVKTSLRDLRLDYVDVLFVHWPPIGGDIRPSLELLDTALQAGLTRHIAVSNYTAAMMRQARELVSAPLATNQIEFHPLLDQTALLAAGAETGIPLSAYSSVARGEVFKYPLFEELGAAYGRSAGQIVLRWILQKGVAVNTMSTKRENIHDNFDVMDFTLSSVDMARIDRLGATRYRIVTRDRVKWAPDWD